MKDSLNWVEISDEKFEDIKTKMKDELQSEQGNFDVVWSYMNTNKKVIKTVCKPVPIGYKIEHFINSEMLGEKEQC